MDELAVVRRRLRAQGLVGPGFGAPAEAVAWLGAVQGQVLAEARWSVGLRVRGTTDADVEGALARGELLRTHVLRATWHLVAREDVRWLLRLTAPRVQAINATTYRQLELDPALLARSLGVLAGALADGEPRTRPELGAALGRAGIAATGLRLGYVMMHAELEGLVCSGPRRGNEQTYALLDDRAPPPATFDREAALAELVLRFFRGHGPATIRDFTAWSSLTVADARAGLAAAGDQLERIAGAGARTWFAAPSPAAPEATGAFLVPMFDETVTHQDLKVVLARSPPRADLLARPIVLDGRTVGSWKRTLTRREVAVEATLFLGLDAAGEGALLAATERFGAFLGRRAVLQAEVVDDL